MFGDRQRRQIKIQPEPIGGEGMVQGPALTLQERRTGSTQLLKLLGGKTI
jgi:hypothetical protein